MNNRTTTYIINVLVLDLTTVDNTTYVLTKLYHYYCLSLYATNYLEQQ